MQTVARLSLIRDIESHLKGDATEKWDEVDVFAGWRVHWGLRPSRCPYKYVTITRRLKGLLDLKETESRHAQGVLDMSDQLQKEIEKQRMRQYLILMEEVRMRFDIINAIHKNDLGFPSLMVREICYLQFRFLCEIIALSCLVAHGNTPKRLMGIYEADKIVNEMQKLKPWFYPQPVKITASGNAIHFDGNQGNFLTRTDLVTLWGLCGNTLHRSPLKKLTKPRRTGVEDFSDIFEWSAKLAQLLNSHWIALNETQGLQVCLADEKTGRPSASLHTFSLENGRVSVESFKSV